MSTRTTGPRTKARGTGDGRGRRCSTTWSCSAAPPTARSTSTVHRSCETWRSEEHTSELQSRFDLVCRLLLEKKKDRELCGHRAVLTGHARDGCREMRCAYSGITSI